MRSIGPKTKTEKYRCLTIFWPMEAKPLTSGPIWGHVSDRVHFIAHNLQIEFYPVIVWVPDAFNLKLWICRKLRKISNYDVICKYRPRITKFAPRSDAGTYLPNLAILAQLEAEIAGGGATLSAWRVARGPSACRVNSLQWCPNMVINNLILDRSNIRSPPRSSTNCLPLALPSPDQWSYDLPLTYDDHDDHMTYLSLTATICMVPYSSEEPNQVSKPGEYSHLSNRNHTSMLSNNINIDSS